MSTTVLIIHRTGAISTTIPLKHSTGVISTCTTVPIKWTVEEQLVKYL